MSQMYFADIVFLTCERCMLAAMEVVLNRLKLLGVKQADILKFQRSTILDDKERQRITAEKFLHDTNLHSRLQRSTLIFIAVFESSHCRFSTSTPRANCSVRCCLKFTMNKRSNKDSKRPQGNKTSTLVFSSKELKSPTSVQAVQHQGNQCKFSVNIEQVRMADESDSDHEFTKSVMAKKKRRGKTIAGDRQPRKPKVQREAQDLEKRTPTKFHATTSTFTSPSGTLSSYGDQFTPTSAKPRENNKQRSSNEIVDRDAVHLFKFSANKIHCGTSVEKEQLQREEALNSRYLSGTNHGPDDTEWRLSAWGLLLLHEEAQDAETFCFMKSEIPNILTRVVKNVLEHPKRHCLRGLYKEYGKQQVNNCFCCEIIQTAVKKICPEAIDDVPNATHKKANMDKVHPVVFGFFEPYVRLAVGVRYLEEGRWSMDDIYRYMLQNFVVHRTKEHMFLLTFPVTTGENNFLEAFSGIEICTGQILHWVGCREFPGAFFPTAYKGPKPQDIPKTPRKASQEDKARVIQERNKVKVAVTKFCRVASARFQDCLLSDQATAWSQPVGVQRLSTIRWDRLTTLNRKRVIERVELSRAGMRRVHFNQSYIRTGLQQLVYQSIIFAKIRHGLTEMSYPPSKRQSYIVFKEKFGCALNEHTFAERYKKVVGVIATPKQEDVGKESTAFVIAHHAMVYYRVYARKDTRSKVGNSYEKARTLVEIEVPDEGWIVQKITSKTLAPEVQRRDARLARERLVKDYIASRQTPVPPSNVKLLKLTSIIPVDNSEFSKPDETGSALKGYYNLLFATKGETALKSVQESKSLVHASDVCVYKVEGLDIQCSGVNILKTYGFTPKKVINHQGMERKNGVDSIFWTVSSCDIETFVGDYAKDADELEPFKDSLEKSVLCSMRVPVADHGDFRVDFEVSINILLPDTTKQLLECAHLDHSPEHLKHYEEDLHTRVVAGCIPLSTSGHVRRLFPSTQPLEGYNNMPVEKSIENLTEEERSSSDGSLVHICPGSVLIHSGETLYADGLPVFNGAAPYLTFVAYVCPKSEFVQKAYAGTMNRLPLECYYNQNGFVNSKDSHYRAWNDVLEKARKTKTSTTLRLSPDHDLPTAVVLSPCTKHTAQDLLYIQKSAYLKYEFCNAVCFGTIENTSNKQYKETRKDIMAKEMAEEKPHTEEDTDPITDDSVIDGRTRRAELTVEPTKGKNSDSLKMLRNFQEVDSDADSVASDVEDEEDDDYSTSD